MQFTLKARAAYAEIFRETFRLMDAAFTENPVEDCDELIIFKVECAPEKMSILEKRVPIEAFANVGVVGSPQI